jgi:hypothetical protein
MHYLAKLTANQRTPRSLWIMQQRESIFIFDPES